MTVDLTDLLRDRLASMDARLARIESKLMEDDEISPKDLLSRLNTGCTRIERIEGRMEEIEAIQGKLVGALIFLSLILMPAISLFGPTLRKLLHLE